MAEFGAHLTGTQSGDENDRPSIFELLAQENLMTSLQPALRYAVQVLSQKNPARYGQLYRYSEEIYALMAFVLEHHYLKKFSASFAENFYGLKRVRLAPKTANSQDESLSRSHQIRSLLCLVIVPYLKIKCEKFYEEQNDEQSRRTQDDTRTRLCRAFLTFYSVLHALWEAAVLYCQLAYVFGRSRVHSPLLALAGVSLKTLTEEDILFQEASVPYEHNPKSLAERGLSVIQRALGYAALGVSSGLSVSVFFLQFLEWWYASDVSSVSSLTSLPIPPPPKRLKCEGLPSLPNICPICLRLRTNDTAVATSGFVFCYPCIYKYVSQHQRCPVTGYPTRTDQLIRLYLQEQ